MPIWFTADSDAAVNPHGPYLYCGYGHNRNGFWVDALPVYPASINLVLSNAPTDAGGATNVYGVLYRWNVGSWTVVQTGVANAGVNINFTNIQQSGYYAVAVVAETHLTGTIPTVEMNFIVTSPSVWAHVPAGAANDTANQIEGYRVSTVETSVQRWTLVCLTSITGAGL